MNALLLPHEVVKSAAGMYREYGVTPFAGGILFEYAWQRSELDALESLLVDLEIGGLEISENYITLEPDERAQLYANSRTVRTMSEHVDVDVSG